MVIIEVCIVVQGLLIARVPETDDHTVHSVEIHLALCLYNSRDQIALGRHEPVECLEVPVHGS